MPSIKEIVEQEIKDAKQEHGKDWGHDFFNNFWGNLPFGWRRRSPNLGLRSTDPRDSERYRSMNLGEFFQDIDSTISELGLDLDMIQRLDQEHKWEELWNCLSPLYIRLREKGYSHYPDLTG